MTALSIQTSSMNGLNYTSASCNSGGDSFVNDGNTFLLFTNSNASARTVTVAGNATSKPGFGDISAADMNETITVPGSGTNGGLCMAGPFPAGRFNDANGAANLSYDAVSGLSVAVIKLKQYS